MHLDNVNPAKIREMLLMRHNQERTSRGVAPYAYHSDLEKSAQTRADQLKAEERTSNTHLRNAGDGYYSYASITDWFATLGIQFPSAGGGKVAFSENIGRGYYTCNTTDCTEKLITALKTTRDFFMSEKGRNGEHYRAITMGNFTQMGIGVSIDTEKKRYYLVIHYGIDIMGS
ncbi:MAG: CAP domain-containing protein [Candidatus Peribacteria bacterium]|nr:CAP domain-containing protein [Candidatus Peribacteria bacterium]